VTKVTASSPQKVKTKNVKVESSEDDNSQMELDPPITRQYADDYLPGKFF